MRHRTLFTLAMILLSASPSLMSDVVTITASKDNTIFSRNDATSNALGILFTNTTNQANTRRALIAFDVAGQIPAGSTVTSASLTLTLSEAAPGSGVLDHSVHRLLQDWGEGTSYGTSGNGGEATPGDATWSARFYPDTLWTAPGGDFVAAPSATVPVGETVGPITWGPSPELVADVQSWVDAPETGHGWILIGTEEIFGAARKFVNREAEDSLLWPTLTVEFDPPGIDTAPFTGIPTLGALGLAILALLMLGAGLVGLRRSA